MKYYKSKVFIFCLILIIMAILVLACAQYKEVNLEDNTNALIDPIIKTNNSFNVTIDPRLELLSALQYLGDYNENFNIMTDYDFSYKNSLESYIRSYRNHEAANVFEKGSLKYIGEMSFWYEFPPMAVLCMTEDFKLRNDVVVPEELIKRMGDIEELERFYENLKRFYHDTGFNKFLNDNRDFYINLLGNTFGKIENRDSIVDDLEKYYGESRRSYNLILVPLLYSGGYSFTLDTNEGLEAYSIIGPNQSINDFTDFTSYDDFETLLYNEFGYSFTQRIIDLYWDESRVYSKLFEPIREEMESYGYKDWYTCLNEHIIRAITTRLVYSDNQKIMEEKIAYHREQGFIYIDSLVEKLEEYENDRKKYSDFEIFYPELLKALDIYMD